MQNLPSFQGTFRDHRKGVVIVGKVCIVNNRQCSPKENEMKDPSDITQEETEYWEDRAKTEIGEPPFIDVSKEENRRPQAIASRGINHVYPQIPRAISV